MQTFVVTLLTLFSFAVYSLPVYETCPKDQEEYTKKLIKNYNQHVDEKEAVFCFDCGLANNQVPLFGWFNELKTRSNEIPETCFMASLVRAHTILGGNRYGYHAVSNEKWNELKELGLSMPTCGYKNKERTRVYLPARIYCSDENQKKPTRFSKKKCVPPRPCFNKSYVEKVSKSFNKMADCFDFDLNDKKHIFSLLNHESGFIANARSFSGAACTGQLIDPNIRSSIRKIFYINETNQLYNNIFARAIEKCPFIEELFPENFTQTPLDKRGWQTFSGFYKNISKKCGVSQNPLKCMFYSFFYVKSNLALFDQIRKSPSPRKVHRQAYNPKKGSKWHKLLNEDYEDFLGNPISVEEVILVKGELNNEKVDWVFKDIVEFRNTMVKISVEAQRQFKIERMNIFKVQTKAEQDQMNEMKWEVTSIAHNGGENVIREAYLEYVQKLKRLVSISQGCHPKQKQPSQRCQMRYRIQKGESLPKNLKELGNKLAQFSQTVKKVTGRSETQAFLTNLKKDMRFLKDEDQIKKYLNKYAKDFSKNRSKPLSEKSINEFADMVTSQCHF